MRQDKDRKYSAICKSERTELIGIQPANVLRTGSGRANRDEACGGRHRKMRASAGQRLRPAGSESRSFKRRKRIERQLPFRVYGLFGAQPAEEMRSGPPPGGGCGPRAPQEPNSLETAGLLQRGGSKRQSDATIRDQATSVHSGINCHKKTGPRNTVLFCSPQRDCHILSTRRWPDNPAARQPDEMPAPAFRRSGTPTLQQTFRLSGRQRHRTPQMLMSRISK